VSDLATCTKELIFRASENRVLRRIFGPEREEVEGGWRRLHNEELHNLYTSPNVIRVIKSGRMRWAGHGRDKKGEGEVVPALPFN
jgi:hypothetical protein